MNHRNKTLIVFYVLLTYVVIQFFWWAYSLIDLHQKFILTQLLSAEEMETQFLRKKLMIIGEGLIFLVLLLIGGFYVRKSFLKQLELNKQQNNFLLAITHELKTPIAAIKLNLQSLNRNIPEETKQELIKNAINDNERLSNLIDKALLSTKIEKEGYKGSKKQQNLSNTVEQFIKKSNIKDRIVANIQKEIISTFDETGIELILSNLIENAVKYSDKNSKITVELVQKQGINLIVKDQGIGISDKDKLHIFDKFYRAEDENTRTSKGTGLGLFVVKSIVEAHNGTISISDNSPKGTTFAIKF